MDHNRASRRTFLTLAAATPLVATALASCGDSGPGQAGGDEATDWILTGQPAEGVRSGTVQKWNETHDDQRITTSSFQNDAYKAKIKTAIGAGQAPTIIFGWGGGTLRDYAQSGHVDDLTAWFAQNPGVKNRLLDAAFAAGTVEGKIYAIPTETVQPLVLFYNKKLFKQVDVEPPTTWDELMALVPKFNAAGIAPFSLGGQSRWTSMMWLELLFDRIGGPELFESIYDGTPNWTDPAAIDALTKVQDLIKAGGFVKGFASITADSNADQALLYSGKAAMMLHGPWTYGSMKSDGGDFVSGGNLGYVNFPAVAGGKGDPANSFGNPAQYLSVSSTASQAQKDIALAFFKDGLNTDEEAHEWVATGAIPVVKGVDATFAGLEDEQWLKFTYDLVTNAPSFGQSWDQALSPTEAETLLDTIEKLFGLAITPQQFAETMNGAIGS
ncbi:extracellular solute-binding protein [Kineococcus rhizosphaerae]|uniref:Raffinose/stachyose/melibiose transport system substrate-binding protein n=1 Tax=Kineococcus rhizosphaerae TaxID=559628 RepID=A0A2T0QKW7_9ACTN|nr:extracellular solute-binding protein [Kineococcus rhizosphaerae]PRY04977.1 raffinose/stachyose/melibiose transport system substrate-binding protein [Kineococcus rhizosphaerae]